VSDEGELKSRTGLVGEGRGEIDSVSRGEEQRQETGEEMGGMRRGKKRGGVGEDKKKSLGIAKRGGGWGVVGQSEGGLREGSQRVSGK